jgi:hypothetical protein
MSVLLGPAGAILLAACYGAPGRYYGMREPAPYPGATRMDRDRDGVLGPYECVRGGDDCAAQLANLPPPTDLDCDDNNAARFPGAADVDGDGVDSNCDGVDGWADSASVASPPATIATPPGSPAPATAPAGSPPATVAQPPAPAPAGSPPAQVARPPAP